MSSKFSVSSSGGSASATEGSTPVSAAIVRPYSKRVIRRSGAGPGSVAQSGDVVCVGGGAPTLPPHPAVPSASAGGSVSAAKRGGFRSARVTSTMLDLPILAEPHKKADRHLSSRFGANRHFASSQWFGGPPSGSRAPGFDLDVHQDVRGRPRPWAAIEETR